jgi:hypothetical protein
MSSPSPDARKRAGKTNYDFPTSFGSKSRGKSSKRSSQDDIDQLFGDSTDFSNNNSPADRRGGNDRVIPDYNLPETTTVKTNYLANFTASSHDFEDSILGELLGGTGIAKRPTNQPAMESSVERSTSPAGRSDILEDSTTPVSKSARTLGRHASAPMMSPRDTAGIGGAVNIRPLAPAQKSQSFRFATELESAESSPMKPLSKINSKSSDGSIERIPEPILPTTKPHHNSFDMDVIMESSGEFIRPSSKSSYMPNLATSRDFSEPVGSKAAAGRDAPTITKSLDRGSLPSVDNDDDEGGINFIPSFLDPGRQGRRRRQLDRPSTTGGIDPSGGTNRGGSKLDELDAILGIGTSTTKSLDTGAKAVVDPFAEVEKRTLPKPIVNLDSDSSSDDGIFRSKPKKKDSFFSKPTSSTTASSSTINPIDSHSILPAHSTTTSAASVTASSVVNSGTLSSPTSSASNAAGAKSRTVGSSSSSLSALPALTTSSSGRLASPTSSGTSHTTSALAPTTPGSGKRSGQHRARFVMDVEEEASSHSYSKKSARDTLEESSELESSYGGGSGYSRSGKREAAGNNQKSILSLNVASSGQGESTPAPAPSPQSANQQQSPSQGIQLTRRSVSAASRLSPSKPLTTAAGTNSTAGAALPTHSEAGSNNTLPSVVGNTTKASRGEDEGMDASSNSKEVSKLADESRAQKQVNDRRMEEELQNMRLKIEQLSSSSTLVPIAEDHHSREKQVLLDQNLQLQQAQIDSKRIISALEIEINRLKDELNVQAAKHLDTVKHQQESYEQDLSTLKAQYRMESEIVERRHSDSLAALKKVHAEEIASWKERFKGVEIFETITQQIRSTTGSMKFLEEQLNQRHRQVDHMREGQFEAREKMLVEMEEKARERAEMAEAEGYKLKGILQHMQQVVDSLRVQGTEDKQRLLQEHQRIKVLQDNFDAEKKSFYQRCQEEHEMIKFRGQDLEREILQWNQEKVVQLESINTARRKVENERTELQAFVQAQKLNLENLEAGVREEEKRLQRQREELHQEKYAFEQRKLQASRELEESDETKRMLNNAAKKLHQELDAVAVQSQKMQMEQEELLQAQQELIRQREALELREQTLREGLLEMRQAASALSSQEMQVQSSMRQLDQRKRDLDSLDRDIATRRVNQATAFRESLEFHHQQQGNLAIMNHSLTGFPPSPPQFEQYPTTDLKNAVPPLNVDEDFEDAPETLLPSPHYHQSHLHSSKPATAKGDAAQVPMVSSFQHYPPQRAAPFAAPAPQSWTQAFQQQMRSAYVGSATAATTSKNASTGLGLGYRPAIDVSVLPDRALPKEVRLAQRAMKETRLNLQRVSHRSLNTKLTLHSDESFLKGLRSSAINPGK